MKRLNRYVHLLQADGMSFIYDISSNAAVALNPQLYRIITEKRDNIDDLHDIHPDLYKGLLDAGMIVDEDFNEVEALINRFKAIDSDPSHFDIIINPTLDCNLRCWYCYETHGRGTMMRPEVIDAVCRLIDEKLSDSRLKRLTISFFGGEPLIGWDRVVMPILTYAARKCKEHGVKLTSSFTTNGVLLTEAKFDALIELGLNDTAFQITFDGNRTMHDSSRVGEAHLPTYDAIMANVHTGANKGFDLTLRFNYTPDNIASYVDILSDLDTLPKESKNHINCNFQRVWQKSDEQVAQKAISYAEMFKSEGISASCDIMYWRHLCYADRENQITINYNGDLFKCTAREFDSEKREGRLLPEGKLELNERYRERMDVKYANTACRECEILPLCNGRCSQGKIESPNLTSCRMNYDSSQKANIIKGALYHKVFKRLLTQQELSEK